MFENYNRYITRGIDEEVPKELINLIWTLIDEEKQIRDLDYLQVFKIKPKYLNDQLVTSLTWSQEEPEFTKQAIYLDYGLSEELDIWVICSGSGKEEYSTMLFPYEY